MGISITELIIVFLVLLLLFGPEQLPTIARQIGKVMAELKKGTDAVRREFYNSIYAPADELKRDIGADSRSLQALKAEIMAPPRGAHPAVDRRRQQETAGADTQRNLQDAQTAFEQSTPLAPQTDEDIK